MIVIVMMAYSVIRPPRTVFKGASKQDLLAHREWFHKVMPERIAELTRAMQGTGGFERWAPDLTPRSLGPLGEWFQGQGETRKKTQAAVAMDIGMYFGQVIVANVAGTKWDQVTKDPRFVDYGKAVVVGPGRDRLEPVQISVTLAYGFVRKNQTRERLRELYEVWAGLLRTAV